MINSKWSIFCFCFCFVFITIESRSGLVSVNNKINKRRYKQYIVLFHRVTDSPSVQEFLSSLLLLPLWRMRLPPLNPEPVNCCEWISHKWQPKAPGPSDRFQPSSASPPCSGFWLVTSSGSFSVGTVWFTFSAALSVSSCYTRPAVLVIKERITALMPPLFWVITVDL